MFIKYVHLPVYICDKFQNFTMLGPNDVCNKEKEVRIVRAR